MNDNQRLQLQKMINANDVEDNTSLIRELKHSHILRENIEKLIELKREHTLNDEDMNMEAISQCNFLFTYYTDIYNKIKKDEIDLSILMKALDVLKDIEDEKLDQHSGAYQFGLLLKEIYVDSALRKAAKIDAEHATDLPEYRGPEEIISWTEYKKQSKINK